MRAAVPSFMRAIVVTPVSFSSASVPIAAVVKAVEERRMPGLVVDVNGGILGIDVKVWEQHYNRKTRRRSAGRK